MMKYLSLFLIFLFLSCQQENKNKFIKVKHIASKIDSLNTAAEVEEFLSSIDTNLTGFKVVPVFESGTYRSPGLDSINHAFAKKLKIDKSFYKADFDNNGYTDLLITGGWGMESSDYPNQKLIHFEAITILNYGNKKPKVQSLTKDHLSIFVPVIQQTDSLPILVLHQPYNYYPDNPTKLDTIQTRLIAHQGNFVEYNNKPVVNHSIEKIEFAAGPCFGTCPMFEIIINKNREAWFIAQHYNFSKEHRQFNDEEGVFKTTIKQDNYNKLISLLRYMNFTELDDNYSVMHTDAPTATLIITYNNGKVKHVRDYGKSGTYGLMALYNTFNDLRFNQDWKPVKEPKGIRINNF